MLLRQGVRGKESGGKAWLKEGGTRCYPGEMGERDGVDLYLHVRGWSSRTSWYRSTWHLAGLAEARSVVVGESGGAIFDGEQLSASSRTTV